MKMSLYNDYEAETEVASELIKASQLKASLDFIITYCIQKGYSLRDAASIVHSEVTTHFVEHVLRQALERRKRERGLDKPPSPS